MINLLNTKCRKPKDKRMNCEYKNYTWKILKLMYFQSTNNNITEVELPLIVNPALDGH